MPAQIYAVYYRCEKTLHTKDEKTKNKKSDSKNQKWPKKPCVESCMKLHWQLPFLPFIIFVSESNLHLLNENHM